MNMWKSLTGFVCSLGLFFIFSIILLTYGVKLGYDKATIEHWESSVEAGVGEYYKTDEYVTRFRYVQRQDNFTNAD